MARKPRPRGSSQSDCKPTGWAGPNCAPCSTAVTPYRVTDARRSSAWPDYSSTITAPLRRFRLPGSLLQHLQVALLKPSTPCHWWMRREAEASAMAIHESANLAMDGRRRQPGMTCTPRRSRVFYHHPGSCLLGREGLGAIPELPSGRVPGSWRRRLLKPHISRRAMLKVSSAHDSGACQVRQGKDRGRFRAMSFSSQQGSRGGAAGAARNIDRSGISADSGRLRVWSPIPHSRALGLATGRRGSRRAASRRLADIWMCASPSANAWRAARLHAKLEHAKR